jgi:hypothetical protein
MNHENLKAGLRLLSRNGLLPLVAAIWVLTGCASPATREAMTATAVPVAQKHAKSVNVTVTGGKETNSAGKSQIPDVAFREAIVASIEKSQLFSKVADSGTDYALTVAIISMNQPSFGFDFTVKMEAGWTLKRVGTGAVVWQEIIKSEHTATTSDAFAGVARLRMANEGAARNNISQGLGKISQLKL